jgi:hypothetical protein
VPTLTITRATATRQEVRLTADDGAILDCYEANLLSPRAQAKLAAATGLPTPAIAAAAVQVRDAATQPGGPKASVDIPYTAPAEPGAVPAGPFTVVVRPKAAPAEHGVEHTADTPDAALRAALDADTPVTDPLLQWDGFDRLCCLDIDYHLLPFDSRPSPAQLECRAAAIQPRPFCYHVSHGRGAKLYFAAQPGYGARELAAVAAVCWLGQDRRATADLVRFSRHPRFPSSSHAGAVGGAPQYGTPGADVSPVAAWLTRSVDPGAVEEWLDARGWRRGQKLPHAECPIDPAHVSGSPEPVQILDEGIYCYSCAGRGVALGKKPGYVPWCSLVGGVPQRAAVMIRNAVHWTHAQLVLRDDVNLPDSVLQPAYSAAVKLCHGPDSPQAAAVAAAGRDIIRMPGRWVSPDGATTYTQNLHGMLNALPAVWSPGERAVLQDRRDTFLQSADISHYGYYPVTPVQGAAVYGHHLEYPDGRVAFATPAAPFRADGGRFAPRYRPLNERLSIEEAWQRVGQTFPGVNRNYVYLLIALKGLAEGATVQAPFAIVTGPSGSGKSSTVHLAASICGDVASEPMYTADSVRLMQAVAGGLDAGSFVVLNEIFKEAQKAKLKPRAAVDPILTMTPASVAHRLYIGPRPLGRLPALVLTDIEIPAVVHADVQLARRLVWVELQSKVAWEKPISEAGFGGIGRYRLSSPEAALACDAILSDVTDRFFRSPPTVAAVAHELGFGTLEDSGDCGAVRDVLRRFFALVCEAPDLTGQDALRYPAPGWKVISRGDTNELADTWNQLTNGLQGDEWGESRVVSGEDWSQLLGVAPRVHFDRALYRNSLYVRFRVGGKLAPEWASKQGAKLT